MEISKEEFKQCDICNMYPRLEGTNKCESCYSVIRHFSEQDPELKDNLLPDLRKKQETSSVGAEKQIFKIVLDEKWISNKVSMIETDNNSVLNKQETLEEAAEKFIKKQEYNSLEIDDKMFEAIVFGAKWQQEKSYSKEEVREIIKLSCEEGMLIQRTINDKVKIPYTRIKDFTIKIFEQFKKK